MSTRNFVPRADQEGNLGTALLRWLKGWFVDLFVSGNLTDGTYNATVANTADAITKKHTQNTDSKIMVGDTSVEIVDTGDGYIVFKEDNTEYMRLTGGKLGIGITLPSGILHLAKNEGINTSIYIDNYDDSGKAPRVYFRKSESDILGTLASTGNGDLLLDIQSLGVDSLASSFINGARISVLQDGESGESYVPANLILETWSATTKNINQLVLHNDGNIGIATNSPVEKLDVVGKIASSIATDIDFDTDEVLSTGITASYGLLIVRESTSGITGVYRIENQTIVVVSANALFAIVKDNAETYNVYWETDQFKIQNKVGNNKNIKVGFYGL